MSFRREPRSLSEQVAEMQAQLRELLALAPSGPGITADLYAAKGDILVAAASGDPRAVGVGANGEALVADDTAPEGVAWSGGMNGWPWTGVGI